MRIKRTELAAGKRLRGCRVCVQRTHGHAQTGAGASHEYRTLRGMIQRCHNRNNKDFAKYGARGIVVCAEWRAAHGGFEAFLSHIGPAPSESHSVDRFPDGSGNYEPGNVRWATARQQAANRKNTVLATMNGETKPVVEWARIHGVSAERVRNRVRLGWSIEEAIAGRRSA
jgi:hypothetical protein